MASILEDSHLGVEARKLTNLRRSQEVYYGPRPSDTVPRVVNELLHTSHAASNGNKIDTHMPNPSQSGTGAGTHLRACPGSTNRHTDNIHPHLSGACYNPSTYVESAESSSNGFRNNTSDMKHVFVRRGDGSGDIC